MRTPSIIALLALLAALAGSHDPSRAQHLSLDAPDADSHVSATLVADVDAIVPGRPFLMGVKLDMEETWHVNWINPGDAGLAPTVAWQLPDGFRSGELQWPHPWRFPVANLVIFGYDHTVTLYARVTPPEDLDGDVPVRLGADVSWLECQEACIPGEATLSLELPVSPTARASSSAFARVEARIPRPLFRWRLEGWIQDDETIVLEMQAAGGDPEVLEDVFFFPYEQGIIDNGAPQRLSRGPGGYRLEITRDRMVRATPERLAGVVVSRTGWEAGGAPPALAVDIPLHPTPR